jgi:GNAT superfamily N-acetyltransferase
MIITRGPKLPVAEGLVFSEAGFDDGPELEELYDEAQAAIEELTGAPLLAADVQSLYISVPSGRSHDDKALLIARGTDGEAEIAALADVIRDHPRAGTWWIGFVMVRPRLQRHGVGRRALEAVVDWAAAHGACEVSLECPRTPADLHAFFAAAGFHGDSETDEGWIMTREAANERV